MTTTISKHELQQQQMQLQLQQQQQQPLAVTTEVINIPGNGSCTESTVMHIQIDALNNNANNVGLPMPPSALCPTASPAVVCESLASSSGSTSGNGNGNGNNSPEGQLEGQGGLQGEQLAAQQRCQKRRSLLNFKSLDLHIKSLYSGLRAGQKSGCPSRSASLSGGGQPGQALAATRLPASTMSGAAHNRTPPYLRVETVDAEESENLLLDYPQSPYTSRRNSSHDDQRSSSSQLLHISHRYELATRSQACSPGFLSPYAAATTTTSSAVTTSDGSGNIRRSSTSDIATCRRGGAGGSAAGAGVSSESRRPSTSDLLRRARERRGSEARMGRSVSHSGLTRGGGGGGAMGGRRTSMAF